MKSLSFLAVASIASISLLNADYTPNWQSGNTNSNSPYYKNQSGYNYYQNQPIRTNQAQTQAQTPTPSQNPAARINSSQPYTEPSNLASPTLENYQGNKNLWTLTDDELAQKIRWAIRDDRNLSPLAKSAEVSVKDKNVTLTGTVQNEGEKNRVASIVRHMEGVKSVSNNLNITGR